MQTHKSWDQQPDITTDGKDEAGERKQREDDGAACSLMTNLMNCCDAYLIEALQLQNCIFFFSILVEYQQSSVNIGTGNTASVEDDSDQVEFDKR